MVTRGEAAIAAYVDSVIERDSYKPQEGEEQTPARDSKLKIAQQRMKLCYAKLNGSMLGEARRRLAFHNKPNGSLHNAPVVDLANLEDVNVDSAAG